MAIVSHRCVADGAMLGVEEALPVACEAPWGKGGLKLKLNDHLRGAAGGAGTKVDVWDTASTLPID